MNRWTWVSAALGVIIVVLVVVLVAGGSDDSGDTTATTTTSSSTTTSTSVTTTTAPPITTTTKPDITCKTSQLSANLTNPDAGAGQRYLTLVYTNNSGQDCTMYGFPGLQLLGPGNPPTNVVRNPVPKNLITLAANGGHAFTVLHWGTMPSSGDANSGDCQPDPAQVKLTSPNASDSLTQPWTYGPVCAMGTIDVNAMQPGTGM
jgi:uncharacterized protein DUF4232